MAYPIAQKLIIPVEKYNQVSVKFKEEKTYENVYWGFHLGEDMDCPAGTEVRCIGKGKIVYSAFHPGTREKKNWGNIIIVAHKHFKARKNFFSVYGHLKERLAEKGEFVELGQILGTIGESDSSENGWWEEEHLHLAIYNGPWQREVLPGYWKRNNRRTKLADWEEPLKFIQEYNI